MMNLPHMPVDPPRAEIRWRYRFTVLTGGATILLMAWGAFVTSINAGLAVPDWPSSFNSYDPFNPWPEWWKLTPVLAEHGHRLLGMLTGALTLILAVWTWIAEPRRWLKNLAIAAVVLVSLQGVLGGLRVVWLSLDLAVVHACMAQLFLGLIVAMALFTSNAWLEKNINIPDSKNASGPWRISLATLGLLYIQIILGALLRHPGTGIDPVLAVLHIFGAVFVAIAITYLFRCVSKSFRAARVLYPAARFLVLLVAVQVILGVTAYVVTLDDVGMLEPSNLQVVVNTSHMVVGALLMAASVLAVLGAYRLRNSPETNAP